MAQATFSVRMDDGLKNQFEALCSEFGMNMATAINIFARAVVSIVVPLVKTIILKSIVNFWDNIFVFTLQFLNC